MPSASTLARRLQFSWLLLIVAAAAWGAWRWPHSPLQAALGAALLLAAPSLVLALELAMAARVGKADGSVPRPGFRPIARAWWAEVRQFHAVFGWRQPFRWRAFEDVHAGRRNGQVGIVLVHGFMCNRGFWNPWLQRLRTAGHPCAAVNLEPVHGPIDAYVAAIDEAVGRMTQATGRPPLVVCHSMGGLAARAWWRASGGARPVAHLVTIASPHHGTWLARFGYSANGVQMRQHSAWLQALARHEEQHPLPSVTCWYSNCDNVVFPPATATLAVADNRFVPAQAHVALAFHPAVYQGCIELLQQANLSRQGKSVTAFSTENG